MTVEDVKAHQLVESPFLTPVVCQLCESPEKIATPIYESFKYGMCLNLTTHFMQ